MKSLIKLRKICAVVCAVVLAVSGLVYYPKLDVSAVTYDQLTYTPLGNDVSYSYISNKLDGLNVPELLDAGATLQFAFSADNKNIIVAIDGTTVTAANPMVIEIGAAIVKLTPTNMPANSYTHVKISSDTGSVELVIKKGNPAGSGEIVTGGPGETTSAQGGGEKPTSPITTTANVPDASTTPKKVVGVDAKTDLGEGAEAYSIDNSVMIAWALSTDPLNEAGYDPTVTSYNIYIYRDGKQVTHIINATNGSVVGGLSAGSYQAEVVAVNSKGEGTPSDSVAFTVTGSTLNYKYPAECSGPKTPTGLAIITANPEVQPSPGNEKNAIEAAWASSANADSSAYDMTVTGYNIYLFDAATGNPYRRVYVDGINETYTAIKSVSAGTYLVYLSALNAAGESALTAPAISLPSKVTVTGDVIDNAQDFNYPNQPALPIGLEIITEGIQYGFTVAWSADANLSGVKLNLYVNGVCIKSGINSGGSSYYENRLASGTYTIEVTAQYIANNVESFSLRKSNVTVAGDPGIATNTPENLKDPSYVPYEKPTETTTGSENSTTKEVPTIPPAESTTAKETTAVQTTTVPTTTKGNTQQTTKYEQQTKPTVTAPASVSLAKAKVLKATKKKAAKKAKITLKRIKGATGYQVRVSASKKFKKKVIKKNYKKVKFIFKKLKSRKIYYVKVRAYKKVKGNTYYGDWSKPKRIRMK